MAAQAPPAQDAKPRGFGLAVPRTRTYCWNMRGAALLALLAVALAAPPAALAGSVVTGTANGAGDRDTIAVRGDEGPNRIVIDLSSDGLSWVVSDETGVDTGGTCSESSPTTAVCPRNSPGSTDVISGSRVLAAGGDDRVTVSAVFDDFLPVNGGDGDDALIGDAGEDLLAGDAGADVLQGGPGDDRLDPGSLRMGPAALADGPDILDGGDGFDIAGYYDRTTPVDVDLSRTTGQGGAGENDELSGIQGVIGGLAGDRLRGGPADERFVGLDGGDEIDGGGGDDAIDGSNGGDVLAGGPGSDLLDPGLGLLASPDEADAVDGGPDPDIVTYENRQVSSGVRIDLSGATASGAGDGAEGDRIVAVESAVGGSGGDLLIGSPQDINFLDGGSGDDVFETRDGGVDGVECGLGADVARADPVDSLSNCEPETMRPPPVDPPVSDEPPVTRRSAARISSAAGCRRVRRFVQCTVRGRVRASRPPARCRGALGIRLRAGSRTVARLTARLNRSCRYRAILRVRSARLGRPRIARITVRFRGNARLRPRSGRALRVRLPARR